METPTFELGQMVEFREKPTDPLSTGTVTRVGGATIGVFPKGSAANSVTVLKTNARILPSDLDTDAETAPVEATGPERESKEEVQSEPETTEAQEEAATHASLDAKHTFKVGDQILFVESGKAEAVTGFVTQVGGRTLSGVFDRDLGSRPDNVFTVHASKAEIVLSDPKVLKALNLEFNTTTVHFGNLLPNPFNPRRRFRGIPRLAMSIFEDGLEQVFKGRRAKDGIGIEIFDGGRRHRSIQWLIDQKFIDADLHVEIVLEDGITDEQMLGKALTANLQKDDLNPLEVAEGFKILEERGMSQGEIGKKYGYSQPAISNFIRLLGLPEEVLRYMEPPTDEEVKAAELAGTDIDLKPKVSPGHGNVLLSLKNEPDRLLFLERILMADVSVAQMAREVREFNAEKEKLLNPPLAFEPPVALSLALIAFVEAQTEATMQTEFETLSEEHKRVLTHIFAVDTATVPAIAEAIGMAEGRVRDLISDLVERGIFQEVPASEAANDDATPEETATEAPAAPPAASEPSSQAAAPPPAQDQPPAESKPTETPKATEPPKATSAPTKTPEPATGTTTPKPRGAEGTTGKTPEPAQAKAKPPIVLSAMIPGEDKEWLDEKGLKMAPMVTTVRRLYSLIENHDSLARMFNAGGIGEVLDFFDITYPPSPKA